MSKKSYYGFKVGDKVTVRIPQKAYYNSAVIEPGDAGVVLSFPPKVIIMKPRDATMDRRQYFARIDVKKQYVDCCGILRNTVAAGIDICNLKRMEE